MLNKRLRPANLDEFCEAIFAGNGTYVEADENYSQILHYYDQVAYERGERIEVARASSYSNSAYNDYYILR